MAKFRLALYIVIIFSSTVPAQYLWTYEEYAKMCAPTIECNVTNKYRTIDGSCNNLRIPWLGATNTPHLRILDAYYDGDYQFRKQADGSPLPNAREIQIKLFLDKQSRFLENDNNVLFMQWGQFIAHDVTLLAPFTSTDEGCCDQQNQNPVPIECQAVIPVPENDPVYSKQGQTCINFNRAATSAAQGCPLKPTTYILSTTHFIDGSLIYGMDDKTAANLRSFEAGRLRSEFNSDHMEFCPQLNRGDSLKCSTSKNSSVCYFTGDPRGNQNLVTVLFQNAFLRFHNVVASHLSRLNQHWCDETLYQEARRFVIAVIQYITYTQYLPILLGTEFNVINNQPIYNDRVDPSTSLEFASGAFRTLHQEIPSTLNLKDDRQVLLTDWMNKPELLPISDNFDGFLYGFVNQNTRAEQPSFNPHISSYLFQQLTPTLKGQDLLTADIQRGRDTGVPPYNKMRLVCGIPEAESFDDLGDLIADEDVEKLKELYSCVDDIDFIVGALLEKQIEGAKVGPTAKCIISNSFYRYKAGDRFFYDVLGQPGSFTPDQIQTLKSITFGNVICATSGLQSLPEDIFIAPNRFTEQYSCEHFPLDLKAWKEN
ncbi:Haem peroxidase,Haem peroxidase, animal type [Cinara cedri]|uniref:Haem peroxidase,Haem peroxidase, animal type n=1 Tax=Cinara cedri TaxID=506608 RepID=A0A5E4MAN8_9HEMI|nr:Haem peroxidase,Haem peroxidase, animal type [Cinara cedri]